MSSKKEVLSKKNPTDIIYSRGLTKYYISLDYTQFLQTIKNAKHKNFYENIISPLNMFFDIEVYPGSDFFNTPESLITIIKNAISNSIEFQPYSVKFIILESHSDYKRSYHVILHTTNNLTGLPCLLASICDCKIVYDFLNLSNYKGKINEEKEYLIFDSSVYRNGLFRTIYSSKPNEHRPFVISTLSDPILDELETFVCYTPNTEFELVKFHTSCLQCSSSYLDSTDSDSSQVTSGDVLLTDEDQKQIRDYIRKKYGHKPKDIREIFIDHNLNCIIIALDEKYCEFVEREHKSNHQYIVIDIHSSKQKCHDVDCSEHKHNEIKLQNYPKKLLEIVKKCLIVNNHEMELIDKAIEECKDYIKDNFNEHVEELSFDPESQVFRGNVSDSNLVGMVRGLGQCQNCKVQHEISDTGYCAKCFVCQAVFPAVARIPIADRYKNLNKFWLNYNQIVNHGTMNINIHLNQTENTSCDIPIDDQIFMNQEITNLVSESIDDFKINQIAALLYKLYQDHIWTGDTWYCFNGSKWSEDKKATELKRVIMKWLCDGIFKKVKIYYEMKPQTDSSSKILKNVKSMIKRLNEVKFKDDIIKEGYQYYENLHFVSNLNSKKHLVPFLNGVYDLLTREFREGKRDDYIEMSVGYVYNHSVHNPEVYTFLEKILPKKPVRDYVLKKLAQCLNGDIPNTNFLMFIGDGANGKSQLLNLAKLTMGEFGEKVEVTLLTRKRNDANEANSEKVKLMNKRFAFLSEPEDGERINIGLLKELTGSEEIVARDLHEKSKTFVMEAKLFLACNELPDIKGEDKALWRRIRVIDFISRFVESPKEENEFKIDMTLPSKIREDITWRQTFMNILLDYYYMDVVEPEEVSIRTNEYRNENCEFYSWCDENIVRKRDHVLNISEVVQLYLGKTLTRKALGKYTKEMEKYIKEKYKDLKHENSQIWAPLLGKNVRGWLHLGILDNDQPIDI